MIPFSPWSDSKIKSLESCPYQFGLSYILEKRERSKIEGSNYHMDSGVRMHSFLEHCKGKSPEIYESEFTKILADQSSMSVEKMKLHKENLFVLMKRTNNLIQNLEKNLGMKKEQCVAEEQFGVTEQFIGSDFWAKNTFFRGKVDLYVENKNEYLVMDYKTTAKEGFNDHKILTQLQNYVILIFANKPNAKLVQLALGVIETGEHIIFPHKYTRDDAHNFFNDLKKKVENLISTINPKITSKELNTLHKNISYICENCKFKTACWSENNAKTNQNSVGGRINV